MNDPKRFMIGIVILAASAFMIIFLYILAGIYMVQYLHNDLTQLWQYLLNDFVFSTITGLYLLGGSLFFFPLCIGVLLIYRGWKGEIK